MNDAHPEDIKAGYECDMPSPSTSSHELRLWTQYWVNEKDKSVNVRDTFKQLSSHGLSEKLYPNVIAILRVLLTSSKTSSSEERANSVLKLVKNVYRSKMSEDQLNSVILIYVHKDVKLDYKDIIDIYARCNPRRMLFIDPLEDK